MKVSRCLDYPFEWAKSIVDEKGLVQHITCKICTSIKRKEKLFLDSLLKHVGCPKGMVFMLGVDVSSHYFNKNLVHGNNECDFFVVKYLSILDQLQIDVLSK
jgi:hypothetical protein